ncbi:MAG: hypothetical protein V4719_16210 [Planctomycetota bacterium]
MILDLLVDAEIAGCDWSKVREADGPAIAIPHAFLELLRSDGPESAVKAYWKLENHVIVQGALFEVSVHTVSLIGAALVNTTRPKWVRIQLLELLFQIVNGESHTDEVARGVPDLGLRCRTEALKILWVLYGIFQEGDLWRAAREIIEIIDDNISLLSTLDRLNSDAGRVDIAESPKI